MGIDQQLVQHRVRHFGAAFEALNQEFDGVYPRMLTGGDGIHLVDADGHRVIDAGNHLGCSVVGHGRHDMADAIAEQITTMEFASFESGTSHPYAGRLADALAQVVPVDDPILSFTNSGSEANEVAIKIARDHHRRLGNARRTKIVTRYGSYHGSTYAATTATAIPGFREPFRPLVPDFLAVPQPFPGHCGACTVAGGGCVGRCMDATRDTIEREGPETIAAILAEPVSIPGAVKVPSDTYWPDLRQLCDDYGILLIADEVVTGFGRTGRMFASEHWSIAPDVMTFAKGLTSGYVPMGGAAVGRRVQEVFEGDPLVHVNTYAGHPVACAAALKTLEIMDREGLVENAARLAAPLRRGLEDIAAITPSGAQASSIGLLGSVEMVVPADLDGERLRTHIAHHCFEHGVAVRVTRAAATVSIIFYPPLTISAADLDVALERTASGLAKALVSAAS